MKDSLTVRPSTFDSKNKLFLVDTHCHIHDSEFADRFGMSVEKLVKESEEAGLEKLVCVGTDVKSSLEALKTAEKHDICVASIALHPHEAEKKSSEQLEKEVQQLVEIAKKHPKHLVAIGETGLDYYYHDNDEVIERQKNTFRKHIELALKLDLPMIFHIRNNSDKSNTPVARGQASSSQHNESGQAFEDFFAIIDEYNGITGVVHSFSAGVDELKGVIERGLFVGLNGIMTFTSNQNQIDASLAVPIEKLVIETDAPFLTPTPLRGRINTPKNVILITKHLSEVRGEDSEFLAEQTTKNAKKLFKL